MYGLCYLYPCTRKYSQASTCACSSGAVRIVETKQLWARWSIIYCSYIALLDCRWSNHRRTTNTELIDFIEKYNKIHIFHSDKSFIIHLLCDELHLVAMSQQNLILDRVRYMKAHIASDYHWTWYFLLVWWRKLFNLNDHDVQVANLAIWIAFHSMFLMTQ